MTRAELLARITTSEFLEWRVLEELEPFGERGNYLRTGITAAAIANAFRDPKAPPFTPQDFIPDFERAEDEGQGADQLFAAMSLIQEVQNSRIQEAQLIPIEKQ